MPVGVGSGGPAGGGTGPGGVVGPASGVTVVSVSPPWPNPPGAPGNAQAALDALITYLTSQGTEIWVDKNRTYAGGYHGAGTIFAPFDDLPIAMTYMVAAGKVNYKLNIEPSPSTYSATTIPAGILFFADCNGGVSVASLTVTGTAGGGGGAIIFSDGLNVLGNITYTDPADPTAQAVLVIKQIGNVVGNVLYSGTAAGALILVGAGAIEPATFLKGVTFNGTIDTGPGFFVGYNADVKGAVTTGLYSTADCNNPAAINCSGTQVSITEAEGLSGFPYGPCAITFTGAAGVAAMDTSSALHFYDGGGSVTNGTVDADGVGPKAALYNSQPYAFGAGIQYPALLINNGVFAPAMENAQSDAFLQVVPSGLRMLTFLEVQIDTELLAGEDFTVELVGCVYDPSGNTLLHDQALSSFDTPISMSFVAGDKASLRVSDWQSLKIGGVQATHITYRWILAGASIYQGLISVEMGFSP